MDLVSPTSAAQRNTVEPVIPAEILLVDDREENLLALEAVLTSPDYHLVKVQSGDAALRYLLEHVPALIVMDVQMPKMDGFETAAIIKGGARTREIPIIFITALNKDERYLHKGYEFGAVDYIYKPFDAQILRSKVGVFVDLYRKNERLLRAERMLRETEGRERERKIAELEIKSLRREQMEQRRFRDLVDGITHGIVWSAEPKTLGISFVSDSAERLTGFAASEWLAERNFFVEHIPPGDRETFLAAVRAASEEAVEQEVEHRFITAEGNLIWMQTGLRSSINPANMNAELRGLSVDITKLKEAEWASLQTKKRSELLSQASLILGENFDYRRNLEALAAFVTENFADFCAMDLYDADGRSVAAAVAGNEDAADVFWKNPVAPRRQPLTLRAQLFNEVPPNKLEEITGNAARARALGALNLNSFIRVEAAARGKVLGTILFGARDEQKRFQPADAYFIEDVAYRVAAAIDNALLFHEAQTAVRVRDEFLAIASHELRTPLTPLKLHAQQLMRSIQKRGVAGLSPESLQRMVTTTNRQVERLAKLIDSLLDITRISRGKLTLTPTEFILGDMVQEVVARLSGDLELAGCTLSLDVDNTIRVRWDSFRMDQVVENLLSNAIKYARGKPIEMRAWQDKRGVHISVRDHGIGISAEDQKRIFKRFERAVSSSHFGGLGLGLYIVTQILDAHRGGITVESEPGKGSLFTVTLPPEMPAEVVQTGSAAS